MLRRLPKLAVAVTALSLAIVTIVFSILDAWLWKQLPLPRAEELVIAFGATKARPTEPQVFLFARVLETWRARGTTIQSAGGVMRTGFEIETAEGREPVTAMHVTPDLMRTLHRVFPCANPARCS